MPAVVVAAPAPALAASGATGNITATCPPANTSLQAPFTLAITGSSSPTVQVLFTHTGDGSFTVETPLPPGWSLASSTATTRTYTVAVVNGSAGGTVTVNFTGLGQNDIGTVTATISATPPFVSGDQSVSVTKDRAGNSANYACSVS